MVVTPDGKYMISGAFDKSIKIFDLETRQLVHEFRAIHQSKKFFLIFSHEIIEEIKTLAVTPDGKHIVSGSYDRSIKILSLDTKEQVDYFRNAHEGILEWNPLFLIKK